MRIMIVGLGYVGLVTGACLASWGYRIIGVDIDKEKLEKLKNKECPIYTGVFIKVFLRAFKRIQR